MLGALWISPVLGLLRFQAGHPGSAKSGSKAASRGRLQHRGTDELLGHFIPEHNRVRREKCCQELDLSQQNCVCRLPGMSRTEPDWQQLGLLFPGICSGWCQIPPCIPNMGISTCDSSSQPRCPAPHQGLGHFGTTTSCLHPSVGPATLTSSPAPRKFPLKFPISHVSSSRLPTFLSVDQDIA